MTSDSDTTLFPKKYKVKYGYGGHEGGVANVIFQLHRFYFIGVSLFSFATFFLYFAPKKIYFPALLYLGFTVHCCQGGTVEIGKW
jgi:hypothetical protein